MNAREFGQELGHALRRDTPAFGKVWWTQAIDDATARIEHLEAQNARFRRALEGIADYAETSAEVDPRTQAYADHILTSIANTARNAAKER